MALLEIRDIHLSFGGLRALQGVGFDVPTGQIVGLIGPNGAGKTTLFNVIAGAFAPQSGRIRFDDRDIVRRAPQQISRAGLVRTFQIARGLPTLTALENLMLYGRDQAGESVPRLFGTPGIVRRGEQDLYGRAWDMLGRLEMQHVADKKAGELSGGQKKLMELGRVLMSQPKMVLLDEPAAGVNPGLVERLSHHIRASRDEGVTFLIVEHNMSFVGRICDQVVVMAQGRLLAQGSFDSVRSDPGVQSAYMGTRA